MLNLIWVIPLLPLLGFLFNALVVWRMGDRKKQEHLAGYVASGTVVGSFLIALLAFWQLGGLPEETRRVDMILWQWITIGDLQVPIGLLFDPLSAVMVLLVTGVGAVIHFYSIGYIHGDAKAVRYFAYLNLFVFSMLCLVMANNLLLLFLGWEGVGLCSFLLIGHWYDKKESAFGLRIATPAAVKAFVVNRIGDAAILLAMMAIFSRFGTLTFFGAEDAVHGGGGGFLEQTALIQGQSINVLGQSFLISTAISFLLLIGVTGKSAQIPLFVWLPDAMAGPTPVSALIHAATMVTAGVYLMARTHILFTPSTSAWVTWIGAITALLAATAAIAQTDIKKVLAYSTVSQLGYMVTAAGMGIYVVAMFHLLTHGIFKALLFLGSGSVIHGTHETQDMRKMGGLRKHMPITFWTYLIGAAALAGIFPLAGFWSKDEILAHALDGNMIIFVILLLASLSTAFYMGRQLAMVFFGEQRDHTYHAHESGRMMTVPLIILAVGAVVAGAMNLPGSHWLAHWLEPVIHGGHPAEFNLVLAIVTTLLALGSAFVGWRYYIQNKVKVEAGSKDPLYRYTGDLWEMLEQAWFFDKAYEKHTVVPWYRKISRLFAITVDQQGIDGTVNGIGQFFLRVSAWMRPFQNGYVRTYALVFLIGVVVFVGYVLL